MIETEEPTQRQSYGTFVVLIKKDVGIQAAKAILPSPGVACNGMEGSKSRNPANNMVKGREVVSRPFIVELSDPCQNHLPRCGAGELC